MKMIYLRNEVEIPYTLVTDPPEAMTWSTYRLKKSHIKLLIKFDRQEAAEITQEILDDILLTEEKQHDYANKRT